MHAIVVGAGLAGAAAAASLARRGWQVTVLDKAGEPAAGASGLPVGLLAPHTSADDNLLSQLSRAGVRQTMEAARELLVEGDEWQPGGALEIRGGDAPPQFPAGGDFEEWQAPAMAQDGRHAIWHARSAWIKPAALVRAWLRTPGVAWKGNCDVVRVAGRAGSWRVSLRDGHEFEAPVVILAAALGTRALAAGRLALNAVRGQIAWGMHEAAPETPAFPVNGNGHFIPRVPHDGGSAWFCGSTYGRDDEDPSIRAEDTRANLDKLAGLLPAVAASIRPGGVRAWAGVRCTSNDRRPLVGELEPGLLVSTAMGSRGLTFCALAGELLAARLGAGPLPLDARLALALDVKR